MNFWLEVAYCGARVVTLFALLLVFCRCVVRPWADRALGVE